MAGLPEASRVEANKAAAKAAVRKARTKKANGEVPIEKSKAILRALGSLLNTKADAAAVERVKTSLAKGFATFAENYRPAVEIDEEV